jgi:hypothetical protein
MDEKKIARVGHQVAQLNLADHILSWDKKQAREVYSPVLERVVPNVDGRRCQADETHGLLQMHASGLSLICGVCHPVPCDYAEPVSR